MGAFAIAPPTATLTPTMPDTPQPGTPVTLREITVADLPAIVQIQQACYPADLLESTSDFANKLQASPHSSWLAEHEGNICAYFFTYPWHGAQPPRLGIPLHSPDTPADTHFWHDLAVLPQARGAGIAPALIQHALNWGREQGLHITRLVAIQQAAGFWQRWGFTAERPVTGYGNGAVLMQKTA